MDVVSSASTWDPDRTAMEAAIQRHDEIFERVGSAEEARVHVAQAREELPGSP